MTVEAIVNTVAKSIVKIKQNCLADAVANFNLTIQNADTVSITGLSVNNTASSSSVGCNSTSQVDMRSLLGNVKADLANLIQTTPLHAQVKATFIATLAESVTVDVVNTCYAAAVAAVSINLQNSDNITIDNVVIQNTALATIVSCLQNVQIKTGDGSLPMTKFIQENEAWMNPPQPNQEQPQASQDYSKIFHDIFQQQPTACTQTKTLTAVWCIITMLVGYHLLVK